MWPSLIAVVCGILISWIYYNQSQAILSEEVTAWVEDHAADCAIVLTGSPGRVREGFDLLSQKRIRKLIISGVYPQAQIRDIFPQWPYYGQVIEDDVVLEKKSSTTYGNAQQSLPLVESLHCKDVILITSRLHMYRSFRIFRSVLPGQYEILKRSIVAGHFTPTFFELFVETTKTIFYNLWAY